MGLEKILLAAAAAGLFAGCSSVQNTDVSQKIVVVQQQNTSNISQASVRKKKTRPASAGIVRAYTGIPPRRGVCFHMLDGRKIIYEYGSIAEDFIDRTLALLDYPPKDEIYRFFLATDKNFDRIIDGYEAKDAFWSRRLLRDS